MIKRFSEDYEFLDNFLESPIDVDGKRYPTVEHFFQASKCADQGEAEKIRKLASPEQAKREGQRVKLQKNWDHMKRNVMLEGVRAKFQQHTIMAQQLLATGNEHIQEGNRWGDTYWGVDLRTGRGKNHLGQILMQVRAELRDRN